MRFSVGTAVTACAKMRVVEDASCAPSQATEPVFSEKGLVAIASGSEALTSSTLIRADSRSARQFLPQPIMQSGLALALV